MGKPKEGEHSLLAQALIGDDQVRGWLDSDPSLRDGFSPDCEDELNRSRITNKYQYAAAMTGLLHMAYRISVNKADKKPPNGESEPEELLIPVDLHSKVFGNLSCFDIAEKVAKILLEEAKNPENPLKDYFSRVYGISEQQLMEAYHLKEDSELTELYHAGLRPLGLDMNTLAEQISELYWNAILENKLQDADFLRPPLAWAVIRNKDLLNLLEDLETGQTIVEEISMLCGLVLIMEDRLNEINMILPMTDYTLKCNAENPRAEIATKDLQARFRIEMSTNTDVVVSMPPRSVALHNPRRKGKLRIIDETSVPENDNSCVIRLREKQWFGKEALPVTVSCWSHGALDQFQGVSCAAILHQDRAIHPKSDKIVTWLQDEKYFYLKKKNALEQSYWTTKISYIPCGAVSDYVVALENFADANASWFDLIAGDASTGVSLFSLGLSILNKLPVLNIALSIATIACSFALGETDYAKMKELADKIRIYACKGGKSPQTGVKMITQYYTTSVLRGDPPIVYTGGNEFRLQDWNGQEMAGEPGSVGKWYIDDENERGYSELDGKWIDDTPR